MNDEDDLSDEGTLDLVLSLPPPVPPVGDGYMSLFCAAHWIATKGGGLSIDPLDMGIWRFAFGDLLDAIASERVRVTGIADRQRAPVPAYLFAGIRVAYPMVMTPLDLLFSDELVLMSRQYLDEEDWLEGDGDALVDRWSTHWRRLMVEKGDVRSRWPFDEKAEEMTASAAVASAESACRKWLESQMRASPKKRPKSRRDFFTEAATKLDGLSERGFLRAWALAQQSTGAAWSRAGRPKGE